jgi:hypothetical protein
MRFGKLSLNVQALADISESEFYSHVEGKIEIDKKEAWLLFQKEAEPFKKKEKAKPDPKNE